MTENPINTYHLAYGDFAILSHGYTRSHVVSRRCDYNWQCVYIGKARCGKPRCGYIPSYSGREAPRRLSFVKLNFLN